LLTEALLRAAHGSRVLATSRQPLDVVGEHTFPVAPLDRRDQAADHRAPGEVDRPARRSRWARPLPDARHDALGVTAPGERRTNLPTEPVRSPNANCKVAALVAEGPSNRDIAERLTIAERTADSHIEHIPTKLGCSSRAQIAAWITTQDVPPP
jgi:DNA-binding CsgD family transcriptional regulator